VDTLEHKDVLSILQSGKYRNEIVTLKNKAKTISPQQAQLSIREITDFSTVNFNSPGSWPVKATDYVKQGALAGA
jgi:hypothetical protein